jgi:hypothetical protein
MTQAGYCRSCLVPLPEPVDACPACGSHRHIVHAELDALSIAHIDCDAVLDDSYADGLRALRIVPWLALELA